MIRLFQKDLKLFFNDKQSVLLTFLLPIILISLFAFAFGAIGGSNGGPNINLVVTDLDNSSTSSQVVTQLDSLQGLSIIKADLDQSREHIRKGDYASALILHSGFETSVNAGESIPVEILFDRAKEMEVGLIQSILTSTIVPIVKYQMGIKNGQDLVQNDSNQDEPIEFKMTSIIGEEKDVNAGLIQAVAGTAILMLLFSVSGLGASILEEKENGTLSRLLYSPIQANTILFGKMAFAFFIAVVQLIVMFVFSWIAFGLDILTDVPSLLAMIVATAFAVSSFGIFLAAIAKTRQQANSLGTLVILTMSAVGGSMIPIFVMPAIMQKIAVVSVNYWGIQGFFDIFWRNLPMIDILPRMLVLIGIGITVSLISLKFFHKNVMKLA